MKTDNIDQLFKNLQDDFDFETPEQGHDLRFLNKLKLQETPEATTKTKLRFHQILWAVAAVLVICIGFFTFLQHSSQTNDLASVSPQLSQTQDFFTAAITSELNKIQNQRTPENEALVSDALKQMELLEKNYERLKVDLKKSGNDKRVVYAMITNLQSRIDLLQDVLNTIENLNQLTSERTQITL
ncbi:hypothetical protein [Gelidibacter salicanalis]|uniref:DUF4179 domain-containing protein n=1 Tax=Gelidibacter salicanalis TaxID=291193 RepID=A0A934KYG3_9FLAO|nr:hypothetical protein [Gelidibacter salicanalis]MBJ7882728.1 hypothetical protein [Gelidibacter salicanalis]